MQQLSMASMWWMRPDLIASLNLQTDEYILVKQLSRASIWCMRPDLIASLNLPGTETRECVFVEQNKQLHGEVAATTYVCLTVTTCPADIAMALCVSEACLAVVPKVAKGTAQDKRLCRICVRYCLTARKRGWCGPTSPGSHDGPQSTE